MVGHQLSCNDGYLRVITGDAVHLLQYGSSKGRGYKPWPLRRPCRLTHIARQCSQEGLAPLRCQRQHIDSRLGIVPVVQPPLVGRYRLFLLHAPANLRTLSVTSKFSAAFLFRQTNRTKNLAGMFPSEADILIVYQGWPVIQKWIRGTVPNCYDTQLHANINWIVSTIIITISIRCRVTISIISIPRNN